MKPPNEPGNDAPGRARELEQRLAAADLRMLWTQARHRSLIENLPDVIWTADSNGRAVYVSPRIEQVFGFTPEDVYAQGEALWLGRIHPDHVQGVWDAYRGLFAEPRRLFDVMYLYQHKDGRWVWIHDRALTTWEQGGVAYTDGTLSDVTAMKSLSEQLRESQKIEAVGRLAAGIAHDFNNLLTAILGYSGLLLDDIDRGTPSRRHVSEIQKAAERAAELTRELLAFSRKQILQLSVLDLPVLVAEMSGMLQRVLGDAIELRVTNPGWTAPVRADKSRLEQVILSLVVNAKDAMPQGGQMSVSFRRVDESGDRLPELGPGAHLRMSVSDTGAGMDETTRARVFEPFFTTKEIGKGTGLGLAAAHGVINQCGGHITVWSAPGQGTRFDVYLPLAEEPAQTIDAAGG
jgi:two-component system cell cycle sensor histidine kinase/response regulator CckA